MKRKSVFGTLVRGFVADLDDCQPEFFSKKNQMRLIGDSSYLIKTKEIYG